MTKKPGNKLYVFYNEATGIIEQMMNLPEDMAELNRQPGQGMFVTSEDVDIDPNTQMVGPGNTLIPYAKPVDTAAELRKIRAERNRRLSLCDWTQMPDSPVDKAAWAAYRQALREFPSTVTDVTNVQWPTPPGA